MCCAVLYDNNYLVVQHVPLFLEENPVYNNSVCAVYRLSIVKNNEGVRLCVLQSIFVAALFISMFMHVNYATHNG